VRYSQDNNKQGESMLLKLQKLHSLQKGVKTLPEESAEIQTSGFKTPERLKGWGHTVTPLGDQYHHVFQTSRNGQTYWTHQLSASPKPGESVKAEAQVAEHPIESYEANPWNKKFMPVISVMKAKETGKGHGSVLLNQILSHHNEVATDYKMSDAFNRMIQKLPQDKFDVHLSPFYEDTKNPEDRYSRHFMRLKPN
jgi:hypothetical protein